MAKLSPAGKRKLKEATSGDYDNLLRVTMDWTVPPGEYDDDEGEDDDYEEEE